jgi:hypothetical protein
MRTRVATSYLQRFDCFDLVRSGAFKARGNQFRCEIRERHKHEGPLEQSWMWNDQFGRIVNGLAIHPENVHVECARSPPDHPYPLRGLLTLATNLE